MLQKVVYIILACYALAPGFAQTSPLDSAISKLLSYSAPAEDWQEHLNQRKQAGWVPPPYPSNIPPDSAKIDDLVDYWRTDRYSEPTQSTPSPNAVVLERLLQFCEQDPQQLPKLVSLFSAQQPGVVTRLQKVFDRLAASTAQKTETQAATDRLRFWLMTQAGRFRDDLKTTAQKHFQTPEDKDAAEAFQALLRLEASSAHALLLQQVSSPFITARCTALEHLHSLVKAPPGPWRQGLQDIVTDASATPPLRAQALKALHFTDWAEKTPWVLTLLADAQLSYVEVDKRTHVAPLELLVQSAPDLWVPKIIPLVGNPNPTIHNNAVRCLVQFHLDHKREDALRPLLPWLSNPEWAQDKQHGVGRLRLLQTLDQVHLPESVPGLLWSLEHDALAYVEAAAQALVHYHAHAAVAVPGLKKRIASESSLSNREALTRALLQLEGLSPEEMAQAVQAYEALMLTQENRTALDDEYYPQAFGKKPKSIIPLAQRLLITAGRVICQDAGFQTPALTDILVQRVEQQRQQNPPSALVQALEERVSLWNTPASGRLLRTHLQDAPLKAPWLYALCSEPTLHQAALEGLHDLPPNAEAVVALLRKDEALISQILDTGTAETKALLLACARLNRSPLPMEQVRKQLDSPHILCARSATLYLETLDTPEARALIFQHFKGEARILGARMAYDPGHFANRALDHLQNQLRRRVLTAKPPMEILALLSSGYWGGAGDIWIEIQEGTATLINTCGVERFRKRVLTPMELATLRTYLTEQKVDTLPPLTLAVDDGVQYEYVHLTAEGGRRVFMNNPGAYHQSHIDEVPEKTNDSVYVALVHHFRSLINVTDQFSVFYGEEKGLLPPLDILIPQERMSIHAVVEHEGTLIVNHSSGGTPTDGWHTLESLTGILPARSVKGPALLLQEAGFTESLKIDEYSKNTSWRTAVRGGQLRAVSRLKDEKYALWFCADAQEPKLICPGIFSNPIASQDGAWAVMSRQVKSSETEMLELVRVQLASGKIKVVPLPLADQNMPITRLQHSGEVLLRRMRHEHNGKQGPDQPHYYLLNPNTGSLKRVTGEFQPLEDETWRPLQPASQPGRVWAALPKLEPTNQWSTDIGYYDLNQFKFTSLLHLPGFYFTSMDMWVDAQLRRVLLALNGDLLSLPLPSTP